MGDGLPQRSLRPQVGRKVSLNGAVCRREILVSGPDCEAAGTDTCKQHLDMPKLTVLMPVYNGASYIAEAIDSVLAQDFADFEFLILDDGSTDGTGNIVSTYADKRIRYLYSAVNEGIVSALNKGIDLAAGVYIARMDADDICLPGRFSRQVAYLDANPSVAVCAGLYQHLGSKNNRSFWPENFAQTFTMLSQFCCIGHPTVVLRRSFLLQHALKYDPEYQWAEDYALWLEISLLGRIEVLPVTVLRYRTYGESVSRRNAARQRLLSDRIRLKWFETVLGRALSEEEAEYLCSQSCSRKTAEHGWALLNEVMQAQTHLPVDKKLFGNIMIRGLIARISHFSFWLAWRYYIQYPAVRKWGKYTHAEFIRLTWLTPKKK